MKIRSLNVLPSLILIMLLAFAHDAGLSKPAGIPVSSFPEFSNSGDPMNKLTLLLSWVELETNAKNAVEFAETAINLADSLQQSVLKAKALHLSGIAWKKWGDNLKSAERLNQALEIYNSSGSKREAAQVQRDLGETYRAARGYAFSEETLQIALAYFHSVNDSAELAKTYNRLAATRFEVVFTAVEFKQLDSLLKTGLFIFDTALQLFPEFRNKIDSANTALNKASEISILLNIPDLIISNQIIVAAFSAIKMDYEKTQSDYDQIIELMHQHNDLRDLPLVLINKARTYGWQMMNQPENAIRYAQRALEPAQQYNIRMYEYLATEILHENHQQIGNYKEAYYYANKIKSLFDQFHNEDLTLQLKTQGLEFQIRERELELKNQWTRLAILITASLVIAGLLFLFTTILVRKNKKLAKLLDELNVNTKIISEKNKNLADANSDKDRFFSIIAHDLRSPFNAFLGFTELMADDSADLTKEEMKSYAQEIRKAAMQLFGLLENLLEWSRLQRNNITLNKQLYPLARIIELSLNALSENATKKNITITVDTDESLTVFVDDKMMQSVLRNLISNAIKFTPRGGKVNIAAFHSNGELNVAVSDNGVGIKQDNIRKLFKINETLSKTGTEGEPSTGLGLVLCKEFIEKHNGKIWVESEVGKGSTFYFSLPASGD